MTYRVVKILVSRPIEEKEVAKQIALMYRAQGFGSQVITEEEYVKLTGEQQQDLTKL